MKNSILLILLAILVVACGDREARRPVMVHSSTFLKKSAEKNRELLDREEAIIDSIISKDSLHTYQTSKDGFKYYFLNQKNEKGYTPKVGDKVTFTYQLSDIKGNVIYSKDENQDQTYIVDKEELFFGLRSAIKLLQEGETGVFYFPSQIAFGYHGDNNKIGSNLPVMAEVTLLKVENNNKSN